PRIAAADDKGLVSFTAVPAGSFQVIATAGGFVATTMRMAEYPAADVVVTLSRGYRAIATVDVPATAGPQLVHVLNATGTSMDSLLDSESDRRVEPPGRVSLGPLAPGAYAVELDGAAGRRTERIRIVDRDVSTTFR